MTGPRIQNCLWFDGTAQVLNASQVRLIDQNDTESENAQTE